jgi:hypothetical protein
VSLLFGAVHNALDITIVQVFRIRFFVYETCEVALTCAIDILKYVLHYFFAMFKVLSDCNNGVIARKAFMLAQC